MNTTENKPKLLDFAANKYSQFGEDGIIAKIFEIIQPKSKVCVEFGAWEGFYHSNTANLWTKDWKGILLESDTKKFKALQEKTKPFNCTCINAFVAPEGETSVDSLLKKQGIDLIDLLSIDVDGDDYLIFEKLKIKPRVVVCEFNPTIPKNIKITSKLGAHFGCSSLSLVELAEKKGYTLIAMTDCNCIFIINEEFEKFLSFETNYYQITPEKHLVYLITDFSGNFALSKSPPFGINKPLNLQKIEAPLESFSNLGLKSLFSAPSVRWLVTFLRKIKHSIYWHLKLTIKPPHSIKIKYLKNNAKKFDLHIFYETGTYRGETVEALKNFFKEIHSIEIDEDLYRSAYKKFALANTITIHRGDSGTVLKDLLQNLTEPALFWLDGHFSGGITGRGSSDTPVKQELTTILSHPIKKHVIMMDDARLFDGTNGYPSLDEVREYLRLAGNNYKLTIKDDILFIKPV